MKLLVCCLAFGSLPALGQRDLPVAPVALYTEFQHGASPVAIDALHQELDAIMSPLNMRFEWRSLAAARGDDPTVQLAVIRFKGQCDGATLKRSPSRHGALGWTHVSDGAILPFSDVDCDRIRGFVGRTLAKAPAEERDGMVGRAIARVLAHELYHIFANTARHGVWGIGKAAYTVEELLAPQFRFETAERGVLRAGKASASLDGRAALTISPPTPTTAPR